MGHKARTSTETQHALCHFARSSNRNEKLRPMSKTEASTLQVWRYRDQDAELVALPPSLQSLLTYDQDLRLGEKPFFGEFFNHRSGKVIRSQTMQRVCSESILGDAFRDGRMTWVDGPKMPGLIEFPLGSCQRVFLYLSSPDTNGEYPIARFDDQPEMWLSAGSLQDEIVAELPGHQDRLSAAKKRSAQFLAREWFN